MKAAKDTCAEGKKRSHLCPTVKTQKPVLVGGNTLLSGIIIIIYAEQRLLRLSPFYDAYVLLFSLSLSLGIPLWLHKQINIYHLVENTENNWQRQIGGKKERKKAAHNLRL